MTARTDVRLLVTNDDGVDAPGLQVLARALHEAGHEIVVAAPLDDRSGSGAAIGRLHVDEHIDIERREVAGLEGVEVIGVDGPPALCVLAGRLGGFGEPPEAIVSGINPGCNTGRAVLHSGTVGAALTAANFGVSAVAVSLDATAGLVHESSGTDPEVDVVVDEPAPHWETAAALAVSAVDWLAQAGERTVVNINVPDVPVDELHGVRWAELAALGTVRSAVVESGDGRLQMELRSSDVELPPDSDTALVQAGYAAVTVIRGITATEPVDVAEHLETHTLPART